MRRTNMWPVKTEKGSILYHPHAKTAPSPYPAAFCYPHRCKQSMHTTFLLFLRPTEDNVHSTQSINPRSRCGARAPYHTVAKRRVGRFLLAIRGGEIMGRQTDEVVAMREFQPRNAEEGTKGLGT